MSSGQGALYRAQDSLRDQIIAEWVKIFGILLGIGLVPMLLNLTKIPERLAWITRQFWLLGLTAGVLTILVGVIYSLRQTASIRRRLAEANPPRVLETGRIPPRDIRIQSPSDPLARYFGPAEILVLLDYLRLGYSYAQPVTAISLGWLQNILSRPEMEIHARALEHIRRQGITALRQAKHLTLQQFLAEVIQDNQALLDGEEKKRLEFLGDLLSSTSNKLQEPGRDVGEALRWMVERLNSDKLGKQKVAVTTVIEQIKADHIPVHALAEGVGPDMAERAGETTYMYLQTPTLTIAIGILILLPALIGFWVQQSQLKNPSLIQWYFSSPVIFLWIAAESLVLFRQAVPKEAWQLATWLKGGLQIAAALVLWGYLGSFFGLEGIGWLFWLAAGLAAAGALLGNLALWLRLRSLPGSDGMVADPIGDAPKPGNTAARFQIFRGRDRQYYFRLLGGQGAIILASEGYTTRVSCVKGIQSVQKNAAIDERYQRRTASNGERYFVLQAGNRQIIGTSETFTGENVLENEIRTVQELAPSAQIEDLT